MTLKDLEINNTIIDLEVNNNNHQRVICKVTKNKLIKDNFENNEIIYTVNYILIDYNKNLIFTDNINYSKYLTEDDKNVHISIMDTLLDFLYYFIEDTGKYNNLDVKEILEQYKNMNVNKFYESYK